ncbi:hypothetical protein BN946_scf184722.g11 [Trametes cinnabarina]|uniref:DUF6534 domain-containing protein n=1 Tax=Pycnoporus cinnabarinus TaxID=5643 RepID=A0A060T013_PYCCI|nr:hypothetical protein BN946_scf184722.g11 [Trametes cinnabarina]
MHACYHYLVSNYFDPAAIGQGVWSINITPVFAALIVLFAECFFARRVVLIGLRPKIIGIVAFLCLVSGSSLTVKAFEIKQIDVFGEDTKVLTPLSLGLDAVADGLLAGTIIVTLRQNRASHANSSVFDVTELYFLNTGLLVGMLQAIAAILAIRYPLELYWTAVGLNAVKMYGVTLLSVLNSRKLLLSRGVKIFNDETFGRNIISRVNHLAAMERWNVPHNSHDDDAPPVINVKVAAEIEVHGESDGSFTDDRKGMRSAEP